MDCLGCLGRLGCHGMGPVESQAPLDQDDRPLQAAREAFPEWDIYTVFGGYLAVPKGATVIQAMYVDGIVEKIRHAQQG